MHYNLPRSIIRQFAGFWGGGLLRRVLYYIYVQRRVWDDIWKGMKQGVCTKMEICDSPSYLSTAAEKKCDGSLLATFSTFLSRANNIATYIVKILKNK